MDFTAISVYCNFTLANSLTVRTTLARSCVKVQRAPEVTFQTESRAVEKTQEGLANFYEEFEMKISGGADPKPLDFTLRHGNNALGVFTLDLSTVGCDLSLRFLSF